MSECKTNIDAFLAKDFKNWRGLPAGCLKQDIKLWYAFRDGVGSSRRGKAQIEYSFRALSHPGFTHGVEFHFGDDKLQLLETEFWSNNPDECSRLLMLIGEPEYRLNFYWRNWSVPSGLWLWPQQGISIGLAPETGLIVCMTVFPPCTREVYEQRYYQISGVREFR
jgi:hypothetical protein